MSIQPKILIRLVVTALIALVITIAVFSGLFSTQASLNLSQMTGNTMGTRYTVKYRHTFDAPSPNVMHAEIERQLAEINKILSTYDPDSELSRFNRVDPADWIAVSKPLYSVLKTALQISRQSEGAFDITIGPLVNLWGFGPEIRLENPPDEAEIAAALEQTGYDKLELHDSALKVRKLHADLYVDLSGIAKGYAVDQIAATLEQHGTEHYMVEIGGEIRVRGTNAQEIPWQIGIEKPQSSGHSLQKVLSLKNTALATSGNYHNYFMIDGRRYMHVIDPATGWPVENHLASVTVLADNCMLADAWATALLVMGLERGMLIAEQLGLSALFISNYEGAFVERATSHFQSEDAQNIAVTFLASFLIMAIAIAAMAAGTMMGRKPLAGSCGGLGRFGLECDAGCRKSCSVHSAHKISNDKLKL